MALELPVNCPGLDEAVRSFGALNRAQQEAFGYAVGLKDKHKEMGKEAAAAARDMQMGWQGIVSSMGLAVTAGGAVILMLQKAKEAWDEVEKAEGEALKRQEDYATAYARLRSMPEMFGPGGAAQAQQYSKFAKDMGDQGRGNPVQIMQAIAAGVGTGANPEAVMTAVKGAAQHRMLAPDTDMADFTMATLQAQKAGAGPIGARNMATIAGKGGGKLIGNLQAVSTATGGKLSVPDLMAFSNVIASELGVDQNEVLGMVDRAVGEGGAGGNAEELMSGQLSAKTRAALMKSSRNVKLVGAIQGGHERIQEHRREFGEYWTGDRDLDAELAAGTEAGAVPGMQLAGERGRQVARELSDLAGAKAAAARARAKAITERRVLDFTPAWTGENALARAEALTSGTMEERTATRMDFTGLEGALFRALMKAFDSDRDLTSASRARAAAAARPTIANNDPDSAGR